ncbi:3-phosphoglycerate dehydrogenase [Candidatus Daviesbacteria bacterium RIFCSPLOWO2_01_FULL_38_10]|nr:MAG: 3-phosphoglycerate dehydrogenase [Candidatus Daviesbacteria bacterium RIFCSPLOWO2_01_FULL_38_10]OGE73087.1 MAG: 3-phosphoglycerate dehydrogenase [Candidatus Daviesbacteria bacterium RIFCSPLOWO2_12_FULL_38_10]HBQ50655.1 phosphoglycerate dehydrogenase [Candidatus Daviesbacteria bacterium]HCB22776.1 phosphoglycerate dehydrogenase [Candidatus Daviesbacteria bacterium]
MEEQYFIIDFDSTIIQTEGLEELAQIVLKDNLQKEEILEEIKTITNLGMEGKIGFSESLKKRLNLLRINKSHLESLAKVLKKKISPSVLRNKHFFKTFKDRIYIITGGFQEFVTPVASKLGILENHILANTFRFDKKGIVLGFDTKNPLSRNNGKVKAVKTLNLKGDITVIGDGFTDLQIKNLGAAKKFIAFVENINREVVSKKADQIVGSFDEFLFVNKLPMSLSYPKSKIKALLLENIETSAQLALEKEGYLVELLKTALDEKELREKIKDVSVLGIRSKTSITQKVLQNANKLKVVGAFCIGVDQMDLDALTKSGIAVFNAPFQNTRSVVELAIGEMIMLIRGVIDKNNKLHMGIWDKSAESSNELRSKTLGIVGYGHIGSQLSVVAEALGMKVIYYDLLEQLPLGNAQRVKTLHELLKSSDIISIHVSGDRSNTNLIGEKEFSLMKNNAIFINLSRGFVVDINALAKFLKAGKIKGAALDVFPAEPKSRDEPFKSLLQNLPNVILTPHIAGSTQEAQKQIGGYVSGKIIDFINTGNTYLSVNLPDIQLPKQGNLHRLLHLHKNVPGILAQINKILADENININGQYLKTNAAVGYVITDVNKRYNQDVLRKLQKIPDTIRFRILY